MIFLKVQSLNQIPLQLQYFYLYNQDYGTLCFLPSDRDIQIPHGRLLSTAWSSAECHWHRSLSNRSRSSTPATVHPLGQQPQPTKKVPGGQKRGQTEMVENIQITYFFPDSNQLNIRKAEKHNTDLNFFCAGFYFRLAERKWK